MAEEWKDQAAEGSMLHLNEMTCLLYLERLLDRARAQEASKHLEECSSCRTLLRALERESRLLTRAMLEEEEVLPSRLVEFDKGARRSWQWIWSVTFGLAATGVYALYADFVVPWQNQLNEAGFGGSSLLSLLLFQGAFYKGWNSMSTLLMALALVTVAGLALVFFRRRMRRGGSVFAMVLATLLAVMVGAWAPGASATEMRKGDRPSVGKDETVNGDLFLMGEHARVDGVVDGDVFVFAHGAEINGHVTGDVIGFAQMLSVNGQVDGNVRGFTNTLTIRGDVRKNVLTVAETMNLESEGKIGGSLTAFLATLNLDGKLGKDMLIFAKHPIITGKVGGTVKVKAERLTITSTAEVAGPIWFEGHFPPDVSQQAKLASPPEYHKRERRPDYLRAHYYVWQLIWIAAFALFGLVLFALMPRFSQDAVNTADRYGASFGLGLLVFFAMPIAAVIACVTVVGLFIGISAALTWYASLYYAQVVVGGLVGQWLMGRTRELWPLVGRMVVGVLIVRLSTTIPVVGGWVKFAVMLWGLGAISLALYHRYQPTIAAGVPVTPGGPVTPLPPNTRIGGVQPA